MAKALCRAQRGRAALPSGSVRWPDRSRKPPDVAAAWRDRCIVPIKPEHVDAWLHVDPADLKAAYATLADREPPAYEHRPAS